MTILLRFVLLFTSVILTECAVNDTDVECLTIGNVCELDRTYPKVHCSDPTSYYYCLNGKITTFYCPKLGPNGIAKLFHSDTQQCLTASETSSKRSKRTVGSAKVGEICLFFTDCLSGSFCNAGLCACLSNYVQRGSYCYPKIDPGQPGCEYNEQCSSVWAGATCINRICMCPPVSNPAATTDGFAVPTKDGYVCNIPESSAAIRYCPLPTGTYGVASTNLMPATLTATGIAAVAADYKSCDSSGTVANGCTDPELYDCIATKADYTPSGATATVRTSGGICCPNRSFTCTMEMETGGYGSGGGTAVRYWFNAATGNCVPFAWSVGGLANANNFESLEMCQTYCLNTCGRGQPQYSGTSTAWLAQKLVQCAGTSGCSTNYQCQQIGSFQTCCSKPSFICSKAGGIVTPITSRTPACTTVGADCGTQGAYSKSTGAPLGIAQVKKIRYFYNVDSKTCQQFYYSGTGGNFNNFLTLNDCNNYCGNLLLCTVGSPLKDSSNNNRACSSSSGCPSTYTCSNGVCCPTAQNVCTQPIQVGSCSNFVTAYWYNQATKQCQAFQYSGCFGNDNNFQTALACQNFCRTTSVAPQCNQGQPYSLGGSYMSCSLSGSSTCPANYECYYDGYSYACCPTQSYTCSITYSSGTICGPPTTRWFFDAASQSCQSFQYNGCDGNSNNFASQQLCQTYCGTGTCANGGAPYIESNGVTRVCSTSVSCPQSFECSSVTLSSTSTISYCCPSKAYICSLPPLQGISCGSNSIPRYYYNAGSKQCQSFNYNGCSGNGNNFATLGSCQNFCNSAGCQPGEGVYLDPFSNIVYPCNPSISTSCPSGYSCRFDTLNQRNVCCGGPPGGVCPANERSYIDVSTQSPKTCFPNVANSCPTGYLCRLNQNLNKFYCCAPPTGGVCQSGFVPYYNPGTTQPTPCLIGQVVNPCPSGFSCQTSTPGVLQGFCCSTSPACPSGNNLFTKADGTPQQCTLSGFGTACPSPNSCQSTTVGSIQGYCCSGTAPQQNFCPTGYTTSGTTPQMCSQFSSSCATPAVCLSNPLNPQYSYCCTAATVCPANSTPMPSASAPQQCLPGSNVCPSGSTCQQNPTNPSSYYCCSSAPPVPSGLCPTNSNPQTPMTICSTSNPSSCSSGYSCQQCPIAPTLYLCCSTVTPAVSTVGCPPGTDSIPSSSQLTVGQMPTTCSVYSSSCPANYNCQYSYKLNNFICCGTAQPTSNTGGCPPGLTAYANPQSGQSQSCVPGMANSCPGTYFCQYSSTSSQYLCCGSGTQPTVASCPGTTTPYMQPGTTSPQTCIIGSSINSCPMGYSCQQSASGMAYCCSGGSSSNMCPGGTAPYSNPYTNSPQLCNPGSTQFSGCPTTGYTCTQGTNGQYVCCPSSLPVPNPSLTQTCPVGTTALMYPGTQLPLGCPGAASNSCPNGYSCQPSLTGSFYCCSTGPNVPPRVNDGCPSGVGYMAPGTTNVQPCNPAAFGSCPTTHTCVFSQTNFRYQCCSLTRRLATSSYFNQTRNWQLL